MKTSVFFILLLTLLSFAACHKDKTITPLKLEGIYNGTLISSSPGESSVNAKVTLSAKTYQASLTTPFGAGSKGSYIINNNQVTFTDSTVHTANFDWGLLLNGTYTPTTKGDSLILIKKGEGYNYTYHLKKQ
ncbi:hypothetical protein [Mucilaginibacter sp. SP1R1]|uniref:hypothetical protein n=1 Tax=Mucilaginibacter sp. SP1R1 TaxID=2723091 RepID=UPI0016149A5F|nr:hypothetical protein [Mucilaginibacter sp. SP1R1]MBB6150434.1 hypothetical protein [Mucilaginibacter sp. SP1R1]